MVYMHMDTKVVTTKKSVDDISLRTSSNTVLLGGGPVV